MRCSLLGCYAVCLVVGYRRFGTTYRGPSSKVKLLRDGQDDLRCFLTNYKSSNLIHPKKRENLELHSSMLRKLPSGEFNAGKNHDTRKVNRFSEMVERLRNLVPTVTNQDYIHDRRQGTVNIVNTKRRLLYLKTQFVPRSKHFSSRL